MRSHGWPYVAVDEHRKAIFAGARVKSFDFLLYRPGEKTWLADVKGRKFPYDGKGGKRYWENWVTREDIEGLSCWEKAFGKGYLSVFVFAYWVIGAPRREPTRDLHLFRQEYYAFLWVPAATYAAHARTRSPRWKTVSVPARTFQELANPLAGA